MSKGIALKNPRRHQALIALCAVALAASGGILRAAEPDPAKTLAAAREFEKAYIETIRKAVPAYVFFPGGSGVMISEDGYMLTNNHVVRDQKQMRIRNDGKTYQARVVGLDKTGDIALLKVLYVSDHKFKHLEFADSDNLRVGQQVIAIGNPFNTSTAGGETSHEPTVTTGIISALHRYASNYNDAIQTDAAVNPGNSGGPLITMDGKLAGINGLIETKLGNAANTGVALAVPANQIKRFLPKLKEAKGEAVAHGAVRGINTETFRRIMSRRMFDAVEEESDGMRNGAEIHSIDPGSPAEKLGLKKGDKIIKVDDYPLLNFWRYVGVLNTYPADSEIKLTYERGKERKTVVAKLEKMTPGKLGVEMVAARGENPGTIPAVIAKVEIEGPADRAGILPNDEILEIDGSKINNLAEVQSRMLLGVYAGDKMKVKVRDGPKEEAKDVDLEITATPAEEGGGGGRGPGRRRNF